MRRQKTKAFRRRKSKYLRRKSSIRMTYKRRGLSGGKISRDYSPKMVKGEPVSIAFDILPDDLMDPPLPRYIRPRDVMIRQRELEDVRQRLNIPVTDEDIADLLIYRQPQPQLQQPQPQLQLQQLQPQLQQLQLQSPQEQEYDMYDFVDISGGKQRTRKYRR